MKKSEVFDTFSGPMTFMGVPFSHDLSQAKAAILGIPFDCGTHPGADRLAAGPGLDPRAIGAGPPLRAAVPRLQSAAKSSASSIAATPRSIPSADRRILCRDREGGLAHRVVGRDSGDDGRRRRRHPAAAPRRPPAPCRPRRPAYRRAYRHLSGRRRRARPLSTPRPPSPAPPRKASSIRGTPSTSARAGRPTVPACSTTRANRAISSSPAPTSPSAGSTTCSREVHERLAGKPVYLCFDMDVFDPSCAPGVCTPAWGGLSAREGLALIQGLAGTRNSSPSTSTPSARRTTSAA